MNLLELERLTRENDKHTNKLKAQSTSIDCLKSKTSLNKMIYRHKRRLSIGKV